MNTRARHLLVESSGCGFDILNDVQRVERLMNEAAVAAGVRVVASVFQPFVPQGVSGVVVIEESHLSIHTWPEYGYAAVDFFTCGESVPERAHEVLRDGLGAASSELMHIDRGLEAPGPSLVLHSHRRERSGEAGAVELRSTAARGPA